jgi:Leucine-rich repeat (LRR) protein
MLSDIKLKIRHAKRGNERTLDLSNMGMSELPADITQLTMLENLNISNNKLNNLRRVEQLPNLKSLNA